MAKSITTTDVLNIINNTETQEEDTTTTTKNTLDITTTENENTTQGIFPSQPITAKKVSPPTFVFNVKKPVVDDEDDTTVTMAKSHKYGGQVSSSKVIVDPNLIIEKNTELTEADIVEKENQLIGYLNIYLKNNTSMSQEMTTNGKKSSINSLFKAFNYLINNPYPSLFDVVYGFFIANRNGILKDKYALQGIETLKKEEYTKVQLLYVIFYKLVSKKYNSINYDVVRTIFGSFGDALINYVTSKKM